MSNTRYRVAIIGCGRMGQNYAEAYTIYPDTEIVAIVDANAQRRDVLGARFGVNALYADVEALLRDTVPDIAVVATPTKYMKDAVIACAEGRCQRGFNRKTDRGVSSRCPMRWLTRAPNAAWSSQAGICSAQ